MNFGHFAQPGNDAVQQEIRLLMLLGGGTSVPNCYLNCEIANSILTVSLVNSSGHAPSNANPILAPFHDVTAATGKPVIRRIAQRTRVQVGSTKTMGFSNATAGRLWFVLFDDTSVQPAVQRLGVINCLSGTSIYPLGGWPIASSTATAGSSAQVFYTDGVAVTSMPYVVLGYATWESGLSTAGTWDALPTRVQMYGPGRKLPGDTVQSVRSADSTVATGTTVIPNDNTTPTGAEGDQFLSKAITPTSTANLLRCNVFWNGCNSALTRIPVMLFQDNAGAGSSAIAGTVCAPGGTASMGSVAFEHEMLAGTIASTTFSVRAGATSGTITFNGEGGAIRYNVLSSAIKLTEVMA